MKKNISFQWEEEGKKSRYRKWGRFPIIEGENFIQLLDEKEKGTVRLGGKGIVGKKTKSSRDGVETTGKKKKKKGQRGSKRGVDIYKTDGPPRGEI